MKKSRLIGALCASFCLMNVFFNPVHAIGVSGQGTWETTLQARDLDGNTSTIEAWYDTELGITWLADAQMAASNAFNTGTGFHSYMVWNTAQLWISAMNADGGTGYLGYNHWRLPSTSPIDGFTYDYALDANGNLINDGMKDGTADRGYNISAQNTLYEGSTASEMAHLFYNTLGNTGAYDIFGNSTGCPTIIEPCLKNSGPFNNIDGESGTGTPYWSGSEAIPDADSHFMFAFTTGGQLTKGLVTNINVLSVGNAWPVHDGDIGSPVPVPSALWLFGSGLLFLVGVRKHNRT